MKLSDLDVKKLSKEIATHYEKDADDVRFEFTHSESGRKFDIWFGETHFPETLETVGTQRPIVESSKENPMRVLGKFFVAEYIPMAIWDPVRNNVVSSPSREEVRSLYDQSPNEFHSRGESLGWEMNRLCASGGGFGTTTKYLGSFDDLVASINEGLEKNEPIKGRWTQEEIQKNKEKILKDDPAFLLKEELKETQAMMNWNQYEESSPKSQKGIFAGMSNAFGALSEDLEKDLLSYFNNPTSETWDAVYSMNVNSGQTMWQIWGAHDSEAPRSKGLDASWEKFPDPKQMLDWIGVQIDERALERNRRIEEAKRKIESLKEQIKDLEDSIGSIKKPKPSNVIELKSL